MTTYGGLKVQLILNLGTTWSYVVYFTSLGKNPNIH